MEIVMGPLHTIKLPDEELDNGTWKFIYNDINRMLQSLKELDCPYSNNNRLHVLERNEEIGRRYSRLLYRGSWDAVKEFSIFYVSDESKDVLFIYALFYYFSMLDIHSARKMYNHHMEHAMLYDKKISKDKLIDYQHTIDYIIRETYMALRSKYNPISYIKWKLGYTNKPLSYLYLNKVVLETPMPGRDYLRVKEILEVVEHCTGE